MNKVLTEANATKSAAESWSITLKSKTVFGVQYSGPEMIRNFPIDVSEVGNQVHGLICEGFNVKWEVIQEEALLCIWEYPGEEPEWGKVKSRSDLIEIPEECK